MFLTFTVSSTAVAPLLFFYVKTVSQQRQHLSYKDISQIIIVVSFSILFLLPFFLENSATKEKYIQHLIENNKAYSTEASFSFYIYIILADFYLGLVFLWYLGRILHIALRNIQWGTFDFYSLISIWAFFAMLCVAVGFYVLFKNSLEGLKYLGIVTGIAVMLLYLIGHWYPLFLFGAEQLTFKKAPTKYKKNHLSKLNLSKLEDNLQSLIKSEEIYREYDLSLATLAAKLGIKEYQLSQYLNQYKKKNFNNYINEYRISKAKALMSKEPDLSNQAIGRLAGFSSDAYFYYVFSQYEGSSPGKFRKTLKPHRPLVIQK